MRYLRKFNENINNVREHIRTKIQKIRKYLKYDGIDEKGYQKIIDDSNLFLEGELCPLDREKIWLTDDNGDFKYWGFNATYFGIFDVLYTIKTILEESGKNSITLVDIGCGIGNIIRVCNKMGYKSEGIEFQDDLNICHDGLKVKYGDVFNNMELLKNKDVIYLYQPFMDDKLESIFLDKLYDTVNDDTIVIYLHLTKRHKKWEVLKSDKLVKKGYMDVYYKILMKK